MRKLFWICASAAAFFLLSGSASAQTVTMHATLNGGEETPLVVLTGAVGTVEVAIDATNREVMDDEARRAQMRFDVLTRLLEALDRAEPTARPDPPR